MHYKYKKKITKGANGTTITHRQTEETPIMTLGEIAGYTYIFAPTLGEQNSQLNFTQITLTLDEIAELETQRHLKNAPTEVYTSLKYANVSAVVQKRLDDEAKRMGYDDINSAIVYLGSPNAKYDSHAKSFRDWKSNTWTKVEELQADIENGEIAEPTVAEFIAMLPIRE